MWQYKFCCSRYWWSLRRTLYFLLMWNIHCVWCSWKKLLRCLIIFKFNKGDPQPQHALEYSGMSKGSGLLGQVLQRTLWCGNNNWQTVRQRINSVEPHSLVMKSLQILPLKMYSKGEDSLYQWGLLYKFEFNKWILDCSLNPKGFMLKMYNIWIF